MQRIANSHDICFLVCSCKHNAATLTFLQASEVTQAARILWSLRLCGHCGAQRRTGSQLKAKTARICPFRAFRACFSRWRQPPLLRARARSSNRPEVSGRKGEKKQESSRSLSSRPASSSSACELPHRSIRMLSAAVALSPLARSSLSASVGQVGYHLRMALDPRSSRPL